MRKRNNQLCDALDACQSEDKRDSIKAKLEYTQVYLAEFELDYGRSHPLGDITVEQTLVSYRLELSDLVNSKKS